MGLATSSNALVTSNFFLLVDNNCSKDLVLMFSSSQLPLSTGLKLPA